MARKHSVLFGVLLAAFARIRREVPPDLRIFLLGLPGLEYHLEFTQHDEGSPGPAPSRDNLLVLYFDDLAQAGIVGSRLAALGHLPERLLTATGFNLTFGHFAVGLKRFILERGHVSR